MDIGPHQLLAVEAVHLTDSFLSFFIMTLTSSLAAYRYCAMYLCYALQNRSNQVQQY